MKALVLLTRVPVVHVSQTF